MKKSIAHSTCSFSVTEVLGQRIHPARVGSLNRFMKASRRDNHQNLSAFDFPVQKVRKRLGEERTTIITTLMLSAVDAERECRG